MSEDIAKDQFDPAGSLVSGKKLPLEGRPPGNYIMSLSISQPGTSQAAFSTLPFSVTPESATHDVWDLTDPTLAKDAASGLLDRERALCLLALGKQDESRAWFRLALSRNPSDEIARARLVEAYYQHKDYAAILSLYQDKGVTNQTDAGTLLRIAESFERTGKVKEAISMLEAALGSRPEDGPLYLALAGYYKQVGNPGRAAELEGKAKSLSGISSPQK